MPDQKKMGDWVARLPVTLNDAEKQCLELIEQRRDDDIICDPDTAIELEAREFIESHSVRVALDVPTHRVRDADDRGPLIYRITDTGQL